MRDGTGVGPAALSFALSNRCAEFVLSASVACMFLGSVVMGGSAAMEPAPSAPPAIVAEVDLTDRSDAPAPLRAAVAEAPDPAPRVDDELPGPPEPPLRAPPRRAAPAEAPAADDAPAATESRTEVEAAPEAPPPLARRARPHREPLEVAAHPIVAPTLEEARGSHRAAVPAPGPKPAPPPRRKEPAPGKSEALELLPAWSPPAKAKPPALAADPQPPAADPSDTYYAPADSAPPSHPGEPAAAAPAQSGITVIGRITAPHEGGSLTTATEAVYLMDVATWQIYRGTTDQDGSFAFANLQPGGEYCIVAWHQARSVDEVHYDAARPVAHVSQVRFSWHQTIHTDAPGTYALYLSQGNADPMYRPDVMPAAAPLSSAPYRQWRRAELTLVQGPG